ncbi:hypothetical protein IV38_GL001239 [Lactobacillus selangorensis]|uniref:Mga helix-turn-helix domain-containing protein n=1 Tax=Lactobacillus selangorensis TaxID=81857 RepID=A0A0R2FKE1_9LACO|nr:helix-turn-helix domain-containing protein [Lactobacillus selangorensis]KRN29024.1 hypothetical protein IV38_GL001239 [Lactobacillus selangorensis]KRN32566.1 hypothetical protein IV40_GL000614 [Lactobacillus selangorensis]
MDFERIMLDNTSYSYYQFYKLVETSRPDRYTIHYFAQRADQTYQKTYNTLQEINMMIQKIDPQQESILVPYGGVDTHHLRVSLDRFRYELIRRNIPYQLLFFMLKHPQSSLTEFCDYSGKSRSTIFRRMNHLNSVLSRCNLRLQYKHLQIVGDERYIRLLLCQIFSLSTHNIDWPVSPQIEKQVQAVRKVVLDNSEDFEKIEDAHYFNIVLTIEFLRIQSGHFVKDDPRYDLLIESNPSYKMNELEEFVSVLPEDVQQAEMHFGFFLMNFPITYRNQNDTHLQKILAYYKSSQNIIWHFVMDMFHYVERKADNKELNLHSDPVLVGNALIMTVGYYFLQIDLPLLSSNVAVGGIFEFGKTSLYERLKFYLDHLPAKYADFVPVRGALLEQYYNLLLPTYTIKAPQYRQTVGLMMQTNVSSFQAYSFLFNAMPELEVEPYTLGQQYDMLITTSAVFYRKNAAQGNCFFFQVGDDQSLIQLALDVKNYYQKHVVDTLRIDSKKD